MKHRPVLLVEDDENDILLFQIAARKAGMTRELVIVRDGVEAFDYLAGKNKYANRAAHPLPCVMFLDLKIPGKSGLEVLAAMQSLHNLLGLVTIVMTGSGMEADIEAAYALGANSYLVKQSDPEKFITVLELIDQYWLRANIFPPSAG